MENEQFEQVLQCAYTLAEVSNELRRVSLDEQRDVRARLDAASEIAAIESARSVLLRLMESTAHTSFR